MGDQDYLYVRDPGGMRVEINAGGYRNYEPDWERSLRPTVWLAGLLPQPPVSRVLRRVFPAVAARARVPNRLGSNGYMV